MMSSTKQANYLLVMHLRRSRTVEDALFPEALLNNTTFKSQASTGTTSH